MFTSLNHFLEKLEKENLLLRITEQVDTNLELTEIHRRVLENDGPALLFENIVHNGKKSPFPVLANLFGTVDRVAMGMNLEKTQLRSLGEKLAFLRQPEPPASLKDAVGMMPIVKDILSMKPKTIKKAPCQEIVLEGDDIDLSILPIQTCWPNEPAPLITWPLVVTQGKGEKESYNMGIYRMQALDNKRTIMRWLKHRGGAEHARNWQEKKEKKMPVAAILGSDPATILAAVTPIPSNVSEYDFSGLYRQKKLELVQCKTIPLKVPANAEIVLEGYVNLNEYADEGPYGDHTGYYNSVEKFPVFEITAITMKKKPIYLTTYTGRPPDEPSILAESLNDVFIPLLQQQFPEIIDFYLPPEGCSYRIGIISIKKAYAGHAKRIMMGIWSFLTKFMYTKMLIVVDEDINIRSWEDVMWAVSTRMDFTRDMTLIDNTPIDYLDFASPESGLGSKVGLDATNKLYPETKREWGKKIAMSEDIINLVNKKWSKYGI